MVLVTTDKTGNLDDIERKFYASLKIIRKKMLFFRTGEYESDKNTNGNQEKQRNHELRLKRRCQ